MTTTDLEDTVTAPFRFGLVATVRSRSDWLALARRAEDLGFDSLLVPDNLDGVAPMLACAAAASVTTSLTVGPYVLATPLRTPGLVAAEAASLHLLADGRVEVGLGAGRPDSESEAARLGVPFGTPGERVGVLETTIAAVRERSADRQGHRRGVRPADARARRAHRGRRRAGRVPARRRGRARPDGRRRPRGAGERADDVVLNLNLTAVGDDIPPWLAQRLGLTIDGLRAAEPRGCSAARPARWRTPCSGAGPRPGSPTSAPAPTRPRGSPPSSSCSGAVGVEISKRGT